LFHIFLSQLGVPAMAVHHISQGQELPAQPLGRMGDGHYLPLCSAGPEVFVVSVLNNY